MGSSVTSVCLQTVDALARDEAHATFTFDVTDVRARDRAQKLMLGSLEFPVVQFSIEPEWNRVYFCQGLRATAECRALEVIGVEGAPRGSAARRERPVAAVLLPLWLNALLGAAPHADRPGWFVVETAADHGLWSGPAGLRRSVLAPMARWGGQVRLLLQGYVGALRPEVVEFVSERLFNVCMGALPPAAPSASAAAAAAARVEAQAAAAVGASAAARGEANAAAGTAAAAAAAAAAARWLAARTGRRR